jgi:hypothetical protein
MEAQAEYTVTAQITDTPQAWVYQEYDRRKAEIFWTCKDEKEYGYRLAQLKDELGIA